MSIFDQIKSLLDKGFILHNSGGYYMLEHVTSCYVDPRYSVDLVELINTAYKLFIVESSPI